MVNNHPPIATPFNNFCPKTLSNQARHQACTRGELLLSLTCAVGKLKETIFPEISCAY